MLKEYCDKAGLNTDIWSRQYSHSTPIYSLETSDNNTFGSEAAPASVHPLSLCRLVLQPWIVHGTSLLALKNQTTDMTDDVPLLCPLDMATTHTISRRKPATYGKASRKPLRHLFSSSTLDSPQPSPNGPPLTYGASPPKLRDSDGCASPQYEQQASPKVAHTSTSRESPIKSNRSTRVPQFRRFGADSFQKSLESDTTVTGLSTSDAFSTKACPEQSKVRKKRKVASSYSNAIEDPVPLRLNTSSEERLLPTVLEASELGNLKELPSLHSTSGMKSKHSHRQASTVASPTSRSGKRTHQQNAGAPVSNSQKGLLSRGLQAPKSSAAASRKLQEPTVRNLSTKLEKVQSPVRGIRGVVSLAPKGTEDATPTSPHTPPHTSPTKNSRNSPTTATTPRQEELWSMLLPKAIPISSQSSLNLYKSGSRDLSDSPLQPQVTGDINAPEGYRKPTSVIIHRWRLVDNLRLGFLKPRRRSHSPCDDTDPSNSDSEDLLAFEMTAASQMDIPSQSSAVSLSTLSEQGHELVPSGGHDLSIPAGRLRATYSSQRSYLANGASNETDDASMLDLPLADDRLPVATATAGKRQKTEAPTLIAGVLEDPKRAELDALQNNSMRTIHELRESGENVRHVTDTEALFDEIDGQGVVSMGLKRERLLELLRRLQDPAYCRLVLDQGFDTRLLAQSTSQDGSAITDALLAMAVLHLVATPSGAQSTSQIYGICAADLLASSLSRDQDLISVARDRRSNISRKGQTDLEGFLESLSHSSIWRGATPAKLSSRLIGLQGLDYLVRKRREAGCKTEILPPRTIQRLVELLPSAPATSVKHPNADLLLETRLVVSILESCTISGVTHDDEQWTEYTLEPILAVFPWLTCRPETEVEGTRMLILRLYLNLTNKNPRLCQGFARLEVISAMVEVVSSHFRIMSKPEKRLGSSSMLDTLILALGTLINLVEWSPAVRLMVIRGRVTDECFLDAVLTLFLSRRELVAKVTCGPKV